MSRFTQCPTGALLNHSIKPLLQLIVVLTSLCMLSACGFHLRDNYLINSRFHKLYLVSADPYSPLTLALKDKLRRNNVTLVSHPTPGVPVFSLGSSSQSSRVVSVYSDGKDAESEVSYKVSGVVTTPDNKQYPVEVQMHRDFTKDSKQALAKMREQEMIEHEVAEMAAEQLVRQLAAIH